MTKRKVLVQKNGVKSKKFGGKNNIKNKNKISKFSTPME